jgi:pyrroloquinoline quinone (PQQ) biosynthesis protein C
MSDAISRAVAGAFLLDHPYYRAWQDGSLRSADIGSYAGQYRHFEQVLPEALATVATSLPAGPPRRLVEENLADERSRPVSHVELFEQFAASVNATVEPPTAATRQLVHLYRDGAEAGPVEGLAVIAAYETQAAEIARTKAQALRQHHGLDEDDTRFWDVHADMEESHAAWTHDALTQLAASPEVVQRWASRSARAWWSFLDDRLADTSTARC